jgi:hypothetical protein
MSSNEQINTSSSAQVAASTKGTNGRTTRAMKAKENANSSQRTDTTNIAPEGTTAAQITKVDKEIDTTSHLSTKHLSSGKVLANSNGKPERKQVAIDSELERRLKAEKLKPFLWATQVDAVSKESMQKDFVAIGYSTDAAKDLAKRNEPLKVDGCSQRPCAGFGKHVAGTGASPQKKKRKPSKKTAPPPPASALAPAPAPPALGRGAVRKVRKTSPAPEPPQAASKKRKADDISADADPQPARELSVAVEETVAHGGEERQKKKRRPGRPKISAARVENSSSE